MRHCEKIIREPLNKAAEVVAKAVASDGGGSAKGKAVAINSRGKDYCGVH